MINVVIPMAGNGQRFKDAGYLLPKPLIEVDGVAMLARVIHNIRPKATHVFTLITREWSDMIGYGFISPSMGNTISLSEPTDGAVCTILKARSRISGSPLLLANCDQLIDFDVNDFIASGENSLVTFNSSNPHHSYVKVGEDGYLLDIVEKEVVSDRAVAGVYYFNNGAQFLEYADEVVARDLKTKGEFYLSSVIDLMIQDGVAFTEYDAPSYMLGTPEELERYLNETANRRWGRYCGDWD